jgi:hypothetical protein
LFFLLFLFSSSGLSRARSSASGMLTAEASHATMKVCLSSNPLVTPMRLFMIYEKMFHAPSDRTIRSHARMTPWRNTEVNRLVLFMTTKARLCESGKYALLVPPFHIILLTSFISPSTRMARPHSLCMEHTLYVMLKLQL